MWPWSPIAWSTGRLTASPMTMHSSPAHTPTRSDVCTERSVASRSPRPMLRATTTPVPTPKPVKMLSTRLISAVVVPMAPMAPSTPDRPTTIISAAE